MAQQHGIVWKKRILVPFWTVRILLMLFVIAIYAYAIRVRNQDSELSNISLASIVVFMLFIVAVLLVDFLAIILFLRDALPPNTFLTMNCFQTGFWTGVLIVDFVYIARGNNAVGIAFTLFVYATFLGLLIYSIINYRRWKKAAQRGNYAPAHNPSAPAPQGSYPPPFMGAEPYQQQYQQQNHSTAYGGPAVELHNSSAPPYHSGEAGGYYNSQPAKPAQMV